MAASDPVQGGGASSSADDGIAASSIALNPIPEPDTDPPGTEPARNEGLRVRTARGVLVNSGFRIGLAGLGLFRNIGIAALITASEYGLWALIVSTLISLGFLKEIGISDKYIQQREADQEIAFQKAFTIELVYTTGFFVLVAILLPVYALGIYGRPDILLPGLLVSLCLFGLAFQAPKWIFYRRLDYLRQRSIEAVDPVVSTVAMLGLLIAGLGLWGLAIGALIGSLAGAIVALIANPYRLRIRFERAAVREYFGFSWPLFIGGIGSIVVVQGTLIVGNAALGLAALGAIGLAGNFSRFSTSVEQLLNETLYPAVCAVQERRELMREAFVTSNRLGLIWALPFGIGISLFAADFVDQVLGPSWKDSIPLMQVLALSFGFGTIAFAWSVLYKALGRTKPIAIAGFASVGVFLAVTVPLMLTVGLIGYAIGMAAATVVQLVLRAYYLRELFPGFNLLAHAVRALVPVLPAVAAVLLMRVAETGERSVEIVLRELAAYLLILAATMFAFQRPLLKEVLGYLRG
jgi:O-antigen/teichoic acid export membrane protein